MVQGLGLGVCGLRFGGWGFMVRVWVLGLRIYASGVHASGVRGAGGRAPGDG